MNTMTVRTEFATTEEALRAGYRRCDQTYGDKDTSGGSWHGYEYRARDGRRSRTLSFAHEKNHSGSFGCQIPMMPLTDGVTASNEATTERVRLLHADKVAADALAQTRRDWAPALQNNEVATSARTSRWSLRRRIFTASPAAC
ncbi:MAG: hypothetical protein ACOH1Y_11730 [Propionicimonas sp.]